MLVFQYTPNSAHDLLNNISVGRFRIFGGGGGGGGGGARIELRGIALPVPSNQIKVTFTITYPSTWYICDFFLLHIEIEGKGYVAPSSQIIGGGGGGLPPSPLFLRL